MPIHENVVREKLKTLKIRSTLLIRHAIFGRIIARIPDRLVSRVSAFRKPTISVAEWEHEYSTGRWKYLRGASEMARYSVIAGYCHMFGPADRVLDVGCGEGIMAERLGAQGYGAFVGIDLSEHAVAAARERRLPGAEFRVADAETFEPDGLFNVIILNEVLYYLDDPVAQLQRYAQHLTPDGVAIVSLHHSLNTKRIWPWLEASSEVLDKVLIHHASKIAWTVAVLRPASAQSPDLRRDYLAFAGPCGSGLIGAWADLSCLPLPA